MRPNLNWSLSRKMKSRPPGNLYPKSHRKGSAKNKPTRYLRPRKHLTKYDKIHSSLQLALSLSYQLDCCILIFDTVGLYFPPSCLVGHPWPWPACPQLPKKWRPEKRIGGKNGPAPWNT
jgi:hypothetical protein